MQLPLWNIRNGSFRDRSYLSLKIMESRHGNDQDNKVFVKEEYLNIVLPNQVLILFGNTGHYRALCDLRHFLSFLSNLISVIVEFIKIINSSETWSGVHQQGMG